MPGISTSTAYADSSSEEESDQDDSNVDEGESDEDSAMSRSERAGSSASSSSSSSSSSISQNISPDTGTAPSTRKKALWHDPADELVSVTLADDKRLRKLARGKEAQDSKVQGKDLEKKLRGQ
jgi:U3 small nucleolar RNA-associated protein 18